MNFFAHDRFGGSISRPTEEQLRNLLESLSTPDEEHPDVSLQSESGWCVSAFGSGLVVLENVETGEGPWYLANQRTEQVLALWRAIAFNGAVDIHLDPWLDGYGPTT